MAEHGVAALSHVPSGERVRTGAADPSGAWDQDHPPSTATTTQESGLRENRTSRLSERTEEGRKPDLLRLYGRVAHRMVLDHPDAVERIAVLDIAPAATMYARTTKEFATRYFWWFFLIQPAPLPERLIGADPEFFLRTHIEGQSKTPGSTSEALFQEYLRCYRDPATRHAICEDYRAAATIDLDHDAADADRRITAPLLALWGAKGTVGQLYDVLETWREKALDVRGQALDCGHTLQEEAPEETLRELLAFLT